MTVNVDGHHVQEALLGLQSSGGLHNGRWRTVVHIYQSRPLTFQRLEATYMMQTNSKLILLLTVAWMLFVFSCRDRIGHGATDYPDSLLVYPGAKVVNFSKYKGTDQLTYRVNEKYPASAVIAWISQQLQAKGWKPLPYDFLNPDLPSSHVGGWTRFIDGRQATRYIVHGWGADWKDRTENIVHYGLRYRYPESGDPNLTDLEVVVIYTPAPLAKQGQEAGQKLREEFEKKQ